MGTMEMPRGDRGPQGNLGLAEVFTPKKGFMSVAQSVSADGRLICYADEAGQIHTQSNGGIRVIILGTGLTNIVNVALGDTSRIAVITADGSVHAWWYDGERSEAWVRYVKAFRLPVPLDAVRHLIWCPCGLGEQRLEVLTETDRWVLLGNRLTRRWRKRPL